MSETYRAAVCTALSGPDAVEIRELPVQSLPDRSIRIAVRAAGVNYPDYLLTRGEYQLRLDPPFTPGMEVAGTVLETSGASGGPKPGDPIIALSRTGGFAEQVVVGAHAVLRLPEAFSFEEGACFMVAQQTAYHALVARGGLQGGETVLVLGATGGVGMAAVQLAVQLGARVVAVGSDGTKLDAARAAGAYFTVNYREQELVDAVRGLVGSVDIVLDPVGGDLAIQAARLLGWGGRFLVVGFASGAVPSFAANLALLKSYSIIGVRAGEAARLDPSGFDAANKALLGWAGDGALRPVISHRFPLDQASAALRTLAERKVIGRVVILNEPRDAQ